MNSRARLFGGLLALILLACLVVIFLDQRGAFGGSSSTAPTPNYSAPSSSPTPATPEPSPATPTDSSGYGNL